MNALSQWLDWDPPADSEDPGVDDYDAGADWRQMLVNAIDSNGDYCRPAPADLRPTLDEYGIPF